MSDNIHSHMGFVLRCRVCGDERLVAETKEFDEEGTGRRTAYRRADGEGIAGVSEGTGDTFECLGCHARNWVLGRAKN